MTKVEIVRGQSKVNWLINGEFNFSMTVDAFAGFVKQLNEFATGSDPYLIALSDVEDDAEYDVESLHDLGGEG